MSFDGRKFARRLTACTAVVFSVKGTFTLALFAYGAATVWLGRTPAGADLVWFALLLISSTALIGGICMMRFVQRRADELTLAITVAHQPVAGVPRLRLRLRTAGRLPQSGTAGGRTSSGLIATEVIRAGRRR